MVGGSSSSSSSSIASSSSSVVSSSSNSSVAANVQLVSQGRDTFASSQLQAASNAVDGSGTTRWESDHGAAPAWMSVDLGSSRNLSHVEIDWEAANAANYQVQGSNNNSSWTTLATRTGGAFGHRTDTVNVSGSYRYVRINATQRSATNTWGYSIWELRVFATGAGGSSSSAGTTPVASHGALHVCGNQLCNQYNEPVQLRGMSTHGIQWYGWGSCLTTGSLDALAYDWKADILRISMYVQEGGYETNPAAFTAQVTQLINEATARGMYALVDFHQLTPGDPNDNLHHAKNFFRDIVQAHSAKVNVIYDVANEPNNVNWAGIKSYAEEVIPVIRQYNPNAVVFIGTHGWASMGTSDGGTANDIYLNPVDASNIMYGFHFYAASHGQAYRNNLIWAAQRLPIFVTEFGSQDYTGDGNNDFVSTQAYMDILDQYKIGWTNWNYSDDFRSGAVWQTGTCAADNWTTSRLKPAGLWIRDKMRNR